jgi:hypothetical protein
MVARLRQPFVLGGTPAGTRMIFEVEDARVESERLNAKMVGQAAADWLVVGPDGTGTLDVRSLVETDDGALVFGHYTGRVDTNDPVHVYAAPQFDTGDERYLWLNKIQFVAKGTLSEDNTVLTYELCEVR